MKKIIAIVLALAGVLGMTACGNGQNNGTSETTVDYAASTADADIWCAPASAQILASQDPQEYETVRQEQICLDAARNEYETAQIIVSAKKDLKFTVSVSDLIHTQDAAAIIGSDSCRVYIQKYTAVSTNYHRNGAPTGKYPDALLPQENAVNYEQNIVSTGENGGAWLSFFIPADAVPGDYTGKATVDLGNGQVQVDIALKVYDVQIPEETTSKSIFTVNTKMMVTYELDSTGDMYDRYVQFLIDNRLAPSSIQAKEELAQAGDSQMRVWARTAYYWYEKGLRTIALNASNTIEDGYEARDSEKMKESLLELAKFSLEKQVDMVRCVAVYDYAIDEPFYVAYTAEHIQHNIDKFNAVIDAVASELRQTEGFDCQLGEEIIQSVEKTPHIITDYYGNEFRTQPSMVFEDGTPFSYEGQNVSLCPKFDDYNTPEQRAQYDLLGNKEKWWYGCNTPTYPYPSYHTDDTLVSAASIGWMMAQYGVTGNLYWVVNYSYKDGVPVEDPYALVDWGSGANGDGTILYPGKMYGVEGPVGTCRLSAILDGNEDYELIRYIIAQYESKGLSADDIIRRVTASVYSGTMVEGGSVEFEEARKILLTVAQAAASDTQLMISSIEAQVDESGVKTYAFTVNTAPDTRLYQNGTELSGGDNSYDIVCGLEEVKNYLELAAEKNGVTAGLEIYLGGMQKIYNAQSFVPEYFTGSFTHAELSGDIYRFTFDTAEQAKLSFGAAMIADIGEDTRSYIIKLNNSGADAQYKVYVTYSDFGRVEYGSGTLPAGEYELELSGFSTVNWERNGELTGLELVITGSDSIGISQIIVFGN